MYTLMAGKFNFQKKVEESRLRIAANKLAVFVIFVSCYKYYKIYIKSCQFVVLDLFIYFSLTTSYDHFSQFHHLHLLAAIIFFQPSFFFMLYTYIIGLVNMR